MIKIQTILIVPDYRNEFWMQEDDNKAKQIKQDDWWDLYDASFTDDSIEVLGPITKEKPPMKIDLRKSTIRLLKELEEHLFEEHTRLLNLKDASQFEKGRLYAHMEIGHALHRIMHKER